MDSVQNANRLGDDVQSSVTGPYGYFGDITFIPPLESSVYYGSISSTRLHRLSAEKMVDPSTGAFYVDPTSRTASTLAALGKQLEALNGARRGDNLGLATSDTPLAGNTPLAVGNVETGKAARLLREFEQKGKKQGAAKNESGKKRVRESDVEDVDSPNLLDAVGAIPVLLRGIPEKNVVIGGTGLSQFHSVFQLHKTQGRNATALQNALDFPLGAVEQRRLQATFGTIIVEVSMTRESIQMAWDAILHFLAELDNVRGDAQQAYNESRSRLHIVVSNVDLLYRCPEAPPHVSFLFSVFLVGVASILHHYAHDGLASTASHASQTTSLFADGQTAHSQSIHPPKQDKLEERMKNISVHLMYAQGIVGDLAADGIQAFLETNLKVSVSRKAENSDVPQPPKMLRAASTTVNPEKTTLAKFSENATEIAVEYSEDDSAESNEFSSMYSALIDHTFDNFQELCDEIDEGSWGDESGLRPLIVLIVPFGQSTLTEHLLQGLRDCYSTVPLQPIVGIHALSELRLSQQANHSKIATEKSPAILLCTPAEIATEYFRPVNQQVLRTFFSLQRIIHVALRLPVVAQGNDSAFFRVKQGGVNEDQKSSSLSRIFVEENYLTIFSDSQLLESLFQAVLPSISVGIPSPRHERPAECLAPRDFASSCVLRPSETSVLSDYPLLEAVNLLLTCTRRFQGQQGPIGSSRRKEGVDAQPVDDVLQFRQIIFTPQLLVDSSAWSICVRAVDVMAQCGIVVRPRKKRKRGAIDEAVSSVTCKLDILGRLLSYRFRYSDRDSILNEGIEGRYANEEIQHSPSLSDLTAIDGKIILWGHALHLPKELLIRWIEHIHYPVPYTAVQKAVNVFCAINKLSFQQERTEAAELWHRQAALLACHPDVDGAKQLLVGKRLHHWCHSTASGLLENRSTKNTPAPVPSRTELFFASPSGYRCHIGRHDAHALLRRALEEMNAKATGQPRNASKLPSHTGERAVIPQCRGWYPQAPLHMDTDNEGNVILSSGDIAPQASVIAYCYPSTSELCEIHTNGELDISVQLPTDMSYPLIITHTVLHTALFNNAVMLEWDSVRWGDGGMRPMPIPLSLLQSPTFQSFFSKKNAIPVGRWLDSVVESRMPPSSDPMILAPLTAKQKNLVSLCSIHSVQRKRKQDAFDQAKRKEEDRIREDERNGIFRGKVPQLEEQRSLIDQVAEAAAKLGKLQTEERYRGKRGFQFLEPSDDSHAYYLFLLRRAVTALEKSSSA